MRKIVIALMVGLFATGAFAANNSFVPASGDWNVAGNWSLGAVPDNDGTNGNPVVVNASKTCTIQSGTSAIMDRALIGASAPGTLIVKGSLLYDWNDGIRLGEWAAGTGILKILDGTVGTASLRKDVYVGSENDDHGTLQIGDGTLGGTGIFRTVYINSDTNGSSLVDLQSGTLDATTIRLGDVQGTVDSVKMSVGGTATLDANEVLIGVKDNVTSAELTVSGSEAQLDIASSVTLATDSRLNFVFDDNGVSTLSASKFWYDWNSEVNVTGTENVLSGTYELIVGTTGGSLDENRISFNIDTNSFHAGTTLTLIHETDAGRDAVLLEVDSPVVPVTPEIGDIALEVSGTNVVVSFNGASGFSYALQSRKDLVIGVWSNAITGIAGVGGTQAVSNGISEIVSFYRIVSE